MGTLPPGEAPRVAIVGARKVTPYGREATEQLARDLARAGCVVISGLALGVDAIAQTAALEAGGLVIGIIPSRLPTIVPRTNQRLAERIMQQGAMMSEWQEGDGRVMHRGSFLERNRLVSGLADAVIITEAAERSGTLNTAAHALAQGREVFAVPGNITSPLSAGCNALLKQGAAAVTCAEDVLERIAPQHTAASDQPSVPIGTTPAEQLIIDLLSTGLRDGEALQQASGLAPGEFAATLTMLEVSGVVRTTGANHWTLR